MTDRKRASSIQVVPVIPPGTVSWADFAKTVPGRPWMLRYQTLKRNTSLVTGKGAMGKSMTMILASLSATTMRVIGPFEPLHRHRVLMLSGEDDLDEVRRRVIATALRFEIDPTEVLDRLHVFNLETLGDALGAGIRLWTRRENRSSGAVSLAETALRNDIPLLCKDLGVDMITIDPMGKTHDAKENDSGDMTRVVEAYNGLAVEIDGSVMLATHDKKGDGGDDIDSVRGSGATVNGVRLVHRLHRPDEAVFKTMNLPGDRKEYFQYVSAKANYAPGADDGTWFRMESIGSLTYDSDGREIMIGVPVPVDLGIGQGDPTDFARLPELKRFIIDGDFAVSTRGVAKDSQLVPKVARQMAMPEAMIGGVIEALKRQAVLVEREVKGANRQSVKRWVVVGGTGAVASDQDEIPF